MESRSERDFAGKHVVVTGASGGLGPAVVAELAARGASCHAPALAGSREIEGAHVTAGIDLTDEAAVVGYYAGLPPLWASIHVAGGFAMAGLLDTSLADLEAQWRINAVTAFLATREAVRRMRREGGGGRVVNVASRPALAPVGGLTAYIASKAAVVAITRGVAEEVKGEGILVNAVAPSIIDTAANRRAMPDADHASWPKPAELATTIAFLASPENRVTSGTVVPVYGNA